MQQVSFLNSMKLKVCGKTTKYTHSHIMPQSHTHTHTHANSCI